jgi:dihydrodipicolinate reductase
MRGAILDDAELELVAAVARKPLSGTIGDLVGRGRGPAISTRLDALASADARVAVDFTHAECVMGNARWYARNSLNAVIGTTGLTGENIE